MTRFLRKGIAAFGTLSLVLFLAATAPIWAADGKKHILIVDMGNIMRSVIAEELIRRKLEKDGLSDRTSNRAATIPRTGPSSGRAWESSQPALQKLGIEEAFKEHRSTVVSIADLEQAAIIIVTDAKVMENPEYGLHVQFPGFGEKMILITELVGSNEGIADAYQAGSSGNKYESTVYKVANVVEKGYKNLLERIK